MMVFGRRSGKTAVLAVAAGIALLAVSCSGGKDGGETGEAGAGSEQTPGGQAPAENTYKGSVSDVAFRTLDGGEKKIADYGRKILVVNYMATWNEDSKKLVPIMNEVQRKFHLNVTVIGVITDLKDPAQVKAFMKNNDVKFEMLLPEGDPGRFGPPRKLPTSHIVTRDDYLLSTFEGLFRADKYEDMILAMYRRRM